MIQGIFPDSGVLESLGNLAPHAFVPERISESRVSPPKSARVVGGSRDLVSMGLSSV